MPTYTEHLRFIKSRPYRKWYVVKYDGLKIGSVYLTSQNEIGIFVKKLEIWRNYTITINSRKSKKKVSG